MPGHRSPNYPGVDLETGIEAVTALYSKVRKGEFTPADATEAWGYSSASGPVRVRLAALRQFGMLAGKRGENPTLSRLALTFVIRNKSSREYQEALRQAAMNPSLFAKAREAKPNASDSALRAWLLMDENFSDEGAGRFVEVFRSTMRLAGLDGEDGIPRLDEDESSDESWDDPGEDSPAIPATPTPAREPGSSSAQEGPLLSSGHTRVPLRLLGGSLTVVVELPDSMTERAWGQMIDMLNALKPGYVLDPDDARSDGAFDDS